MDQLLTLDEASARFRKSPRSLRAYIHAGMLPASKVGKSYLVSLSDLQALFRPVIHAPLASAGMRESPHDREVRQLARAGVSFGK